MSFHRAAGISGILFGVLLLVGLLVGGSPPAADASAAKIVQYVADHEGALKLAAGAASLGGLFAIIWIVGAFERLRAGDDTARSWALVAIVGVVLTGGLAAATNGVTAVLVAGGRGLGDGTVLALWKTTWVDTAFLGAFLGVALLGFGLAGLRAGVGAKWLNYLVLVGAAASIVGAAAPTEVAGGSPLGFAVFLAYLIFILFVVVSSIEMLRAPEAPSGSAG